MSQWRHINSSLIIGYTKYICFSRSNQFKLISNIFYWVLHPDNDYYRTIVLVTSINRKTKYFGDTIGRTMRFNSNVRPYLLLLIVGILLLLGYVYFSFFSERLSRYISIDEDQKSSSLSKPMFRSRERNMVSPEKLIYKQSSVLNGRTDVVAVTPWLAPIVWEGTFDPVIVDNIYKPMNLTIATTVFAIGKYVRFLQDFLETAEKHFMVDFNVHYYVFTDRPHDVPSVNLTQGRHLSVIQVPGSNRWQEISARRMKIIQTTIERLISREADYIFCLDVDSKFHARWGAESLGRLVAVIHPSYYDHTRDQFPYERRPASAAYIPMDEGDYYYGGAMIGGFVEDVYTLTKVCQNRFDEDARNSIEAAWQEESHLNRYLLYNKPSKVWSPEYLWQDFKSKTKEVKVIRFSGVIKNYAEIRPNV